MAGFGRVCDAAGFRTRVDIAFYVEVGNFWGPKLEGKNTTACYFACLKKEKIFFRKWASFGARMLGNKSTQKPTRQIGMQIPWFPKKHIWIWESNQQPATNHSSFKVNGPDTPNI